MGVEKLLAEGREVAFISSPAVSPTSGPAGIPSASPARLRCVTCTVRQPNKGWEIMNRLAVPLRTYSKSNRSGRPGSGGSRVRVRASEPLRFRDLALPPLGLPVLPLFLAARLPMAEPTALSILSDKQENSSECSFPSRSFVLKTIPG